MDMRVSGIAVNDPNFPLSVPRSSWLLVSDSTPLVEIREILSEYQGKSNPVVVIGVVKDLADPNSCFGLVDVEELLDE